MTAVKIHHWRLGLPGSLAWGDSLPGPSLQTGVKLDGDVVYVESVIPACLEGLVLNAPHARDPGSLKSVVFIHLHRRIDSV